MKGYGKHLLQIIPAFDNVPIECLQSVEYIEFVLCKIGVQQDSRDLYGGYAPFQVEHGMLQSPHELARLLLFLSTKKIESYCEIGIHNGVTWSIVTAYLRRFDLKSSYGLDIQPFTSLLPYPEMQFLLGTSERYKQTCVDAVFIDGDHTYDWAMRDYRNISARYSIFHDIYDYDVEKHYKPSCAHAYLELRKTHVYYETNYRYGAFGIGVIINE